MEDVYEETWEDTIRQGINIIYLANWFAALITYSSEHKQTDPFWICVFSN